MQFAKAAWASIFLTVLCLPADGAADFDLEILFPVPKTVVVPEDADPSIYAELAQVRDLTVEIRMAGNMMRDVLVDRLNGPLASANKRVVLSGKVKQVHVKQLRRVRRLEVVYRLGPEGMGNRTFNALYDLGPIRKYILMPADVRPEHLTRIARLKFYVPVVEAGKGALPASLVAWLEDKRQRSNHFVLGADTPPAQVVELTRFTPLHLEIDTRNNQIPEKLFSVIKDLRGVQVVLRVDGRLTLADARRFSGLERFAIRVDLGQPASYTPGLFRLLNRIAPPR